MAKRTLFIVNPAKLSTRLEQLIVEQKNISNELEVRQVPIEDISIIILESLQITVTTAAINKLMENNVVVVSCNEKLIPNGLLIPIEGNTLLQERYWLQFAASEPLKKKLWQQTVEAKIKNQAAVLDYLGIENNKLRIMSNDVMSGDAGNIEGAAAAYYFDKIFTEFLIKFKRSREGDAPNNLLNYGYAILRANVTREIVAAGLLPALGLHHRNKYNAYCLADDIMEPFRPFVDVCVIDILKGETNVSLLTKELKSQLIMVTSKDAIYKKEICVLATAIDKVCSNLVKCYSGEVRKLIYPLLKL